MGRTEALQGVRMAMFLNLLLRWESADGGGGVARGERADVSPLARPLRAGARSGLLDRRLGRASGRRVRSTGRRKWMRIIASATRVSASNTSTSIW
jgi:hypothetical protein